MLTVFGIGNILFASTRSPKRVMPTDVEILQFTSTDSLTLASSFAATHLPRGFFFACRIEKTSANAGFTWIMVGFELALSCLI